MNFGWMQELKGLNKNNMNKKYYKYKVTLEFEVAETFANTDSGDVTPTLTQPQYWKILEDIENKFKLSSPEKFIKKIEYSGEIK